MSDFERSVNFVLSHEGGYVNDLEDPGGETNYGISKRAYPDVDIKNLTQDDASAIYNRDYWVPSGCDDLTFPLNLIVFDTAVNCGRVRAWKWLTATKDSGEYLDLRTSYYRDLVTRNPKMGKYLKGWLNRLTDISKEAGIV